MSPRLRRLATRLAALSAAAVVAGVAGVGLLWVALPDPAGLSSRNPATTALIEQRRAEAARAHRRFRPRQAWVPLDRISPRLVDAVVASEDAKFFEHRGFDWEALWEAARHDLSRGRFARGASTITQQLAKNLYLGTEKSLLRKAKEALLAVKLERALGKRRILALYLNVAEWGDGVFGVEAGARRHLGVSAADLDTAQAVLLAAMLPAPRRVDLARPSAWLRARATGLLDRLHDEHRIGDEEHRTSSAALDRLLAGPPPPDDRAEPPEEEPPPPTGPPDTGPVAAPAPEEPAPAPAPEASPAGLSPPPAPPPPIPPEAAAAGSGPDSPPGPSPEGAAPPQGAGTTGQSDGSPPAQDAPPHE